MVDIWAGSLVCEKWQYGWVNEDNIRNIDLLEPLRDSDDQPLKKVTQNYHIIALRSFWNIWPSAELNPWPLNAWNWANKKSGRWLSWNSASWRAFDGAGRGDPGFPPRSRDTPFTILHWPARLRTLRVGSRWDRPERGRAISARQRR